MLRRAARVFNFHGYARRVNGSYLTHSAQIVGKLPHFYLQRDRYSLQTCMNARFSGIVQKVNRLITYVLHPSHQQAAAFPPTGRRLYPADLYERSVSRARAEGLRAHNLRTAPTPSTNCRISTYRAMPISCRPA